MGRTTTGRRALRAALALACAAHLAAAQSLARLGDTTLLARTMHFPSPRAATWITIGSTIAPMVAGAAIASRTQERGGSALFLAGVVAGPAMGAWYGGTLSGSWNGTLLRAGGVALAAAAASGCSRSARSLSGCSAGEATAVVGGAALALGSAIYEMATVGDRVREHNSEVARAMVLPLFSPSMRRVGVEVVVGL